MAEHRTNFCYKEHFMKYFEMLRISSNIQCGGVITGIFNFYPNFDQINIKTHDLSS